MNKEIEVLTVLMNTNAYQQNVREEIWDAFFNKISYKLEKSELLSDYINMLKDTVNGVGETLGAIEKVLPTYDAQVDEILHDYRELLIEKCNKIVDDIADRVEISHDEVEEHISQVLRISKKIGILTLKLGSVESI